MNILKRIPLALAGLALATAASAATITGSIAFSALGTVSYTGANLANATSVTLPSVGAGTGVTLVAVGTGDFDCVSNPGADCVAVASTVDVNPLVFSIPPAAYTDFIIFDALAPNRYKFSVASWQVSSGLPGNDDLTVKLLGTFNDTVLGQSDSGSVIFSLTQAGGVGNAVSFSGSFSTPAAPRFFDTPEPGTLALFGSGLLVAALVARRKARKA